MSFTINDARAAQVAKWMLWTLCIAAPAAVLLLCYLVGKSVRWEP